MEQKIKFYTSPIVEVLLITPERGFAQTLGGGVVDYTPGASDSIDD